jgi:hypothetical protein
VECEDNVSAGSGKKVGCGNILNNQPYGFGLKQIFVASFSSRLYWKAFFKTQSLKKDPLKNDELRQ